MKRKAHDNQKTHTFSTAYRTRSWRRILDMLSEQTGVTFEDVCRYAGIRYNEQGASFYVKIPKRRQSFIGIGMAFGQDLEVINDWITRFGGKRKLYVKDITEDLVWIYLIGANTAQGASAGARSKRNYYALYEKCLAVTQATWQEMWDELTIGARSTADVEIELANVDYDNVFAGLKDFIADHMDSFKTAYTRPRRYLDRYVESILETCRANPQHTQIRTLSDLRGWLDDSMINYLAGDSSTINVIDAKSRRRTIRIKHIPQNKNTHIALCLSLGMTAKEINEYLDLMGFGPLDPDNPKENTLIAMLAVWEELNPLPRMYKSKVFDGQQIVLTDLEELRAVEEMLQLRQVLDAEYRKRKIDFPYLRWPKEKA